MERSCGTKHRCQVMSVHHSYGSIKQAQRLAHKGKTSLGDSWQAPACVNEPFSFLVNSPLATLSGPEEKQVSTPLDDPSLPVFPPRPRLTLRRRRLSSDTMIRMPLAVHSTNRPEAQPLPRRRKGPDAAMPSVTKAIPDAFRTPSPLSAELTMTAGSTCQPPASTPLARWSHAGLQRDSPLTHLKTTPFLYGHGTARKQYPVVLTCTSVSARISPTVTPVALCIRRSSQKSAPKHAHEHLVQVIANCE